MMKSFWGPCVCCSVLQCVAVCCSVLQCVAVCCSVLLCIHRPRRSDWKQLHNQNFNKFSRQSPWLSNKFPWEFPKFQTGFHRGKRQSPDYMGKPHISWDSELLPYCHLILIVNPIGILVRWPKLSNNLYATLSAIGCAIKYAKCNTYWLDAFYHAWYCFHWI